MKKTILISFIIILSLFMCACSNIPVGDDCQFLVNAQWQGTDEQCTNVIDFKEENGFSNWCACGSPVGNGDVVEEFRYIEKDKCILLYDSEKELVDTGKILFCDDMYLVIDLWSSVYVYENTAGFLPEVHAEAKDIIEDDGSTKPYLAVLDYEDKALTLSSYDYDGDAKDEYNVWDLPAADDVEFKSVSVMVKNDVAETDVKILSSEDIKDIGDFYTCGYVNINSDGLVEEVIFYGETIVWDSTIQ